MTFLINLSTRPRRETRASPRGVTPKRAQNKPFHGLRMAPKTAPPPVGVITTGGTRRPDVFREFLNDNSKMIKPIVKDNKVVFGPCRLSYTHLFSKYSPDGDPSNGKYMTNVLIPKEEKETVKAIQQAIDAAKRAAVVGKWGGKEPKKIDLPLRDGDVDKEDDDVYAGHYFINAKSTTRPGVCDKNKAPIMDEDEVYSGMWALVSVTFFGYDVSGNRGVAVGLNNVMKYKDDERLGGRSSADSDFADIDMEEDDDL